MSGTRSPLAAALALILGLMLSPHLATAQSAPIDEWVGELHATATQVHGFHAGRAPLVGLLRDDTGGLLPPASFGLKAQHLRIDVDRGEPSMDTAGSRHAIFAETQTSQHDHATVWGLAVRPDQRFDVVPLDDDQPPMVMVSGTCSAWSVSPDQTMHRKPTVKLARPVTTVDAANSLSWRDCSASATLVIRGDMRIALWEWDAEVTGVQTHQLIRTGQQPWNGTISGATGVAGNPVHRVAEAFLVVTNGTLRLPMSGQDGDRLLLHPAVHVKAEGKVILQGGVGRLHHGSVSREIAAEAMLLEGAMEVLMHRPQSAPSRFETHVMGGLDRVDLDGRSLDLSWFVEDDAAPALYMRPTAAFMGIAGMILVGASGVQAGRWGLLPVGRNHVVRLKEFATLQAEQRNRHRVAVFLFGLLLRRDPWDGEVYSLRAWSRTVLGDVGGAVFDFEEAHERLLGTHLVADNAYRAAQSAGQRGALVEVARWLEIVECIDPGAVEELVPKDPMIPSEVLQIMRGRPVGDESSYA